MKHQMVVKIKDALNAQEMALKAFLDIDGAFDNNFIEKASHQI